MSSSSTVTPHTSQLISALSELREVFGDTVALLHLDVPELIFERQLPLVALTLE